MKNYFGGWPLYAARCFQRIDFICGGVIAVVYFFLADRVGLGHVRGVVTTGIIVFSLVESGYRVYREERDMRDRIERTVRLTARLENYHGRHESEDTASLKVDVSWEIWTDRDVLVT